MPSECYGRTNGGSPCELPDGHYPATHHLVTYGPPGRGFLAWTDESMKQFAESELTRTLDAPDA